MKDGYSTAGGMGIGLPGAKRLVDDFYLSSTPSNGTCVTIVRWKA
jgi:serine/threonine-protein kinase RsbT